MEFLFLLVVVCAVCSWVGWKIGKPKGREDVGFVLGLLLGIVGLVIIALMPPKS